MMTIDGDRPKSRRVCHRVARRTITNAGDERCVAFGQHTLRQRWQR
ncbi:MAG: hypothetical protein VKL39_11645 [Leptolyngbyaceae bacterium]|nr:hypothetical protein [Leptolyngbyaceae bacterium]